MRKVDPSKFEEERQEILSAAGRCFFRHGLRGASIAAGSGRVRGVDIVEPATRLGERM